MRTGTEIPYYWRPPSPLPDKKPTKGYRSDKEETGVILGTAHSHGDGAITHASFPHETGLKLIKHAELFNNRSAIFS